MLPPSAIIPAKPSIRISPESGEVITRSTPSILNVAVLVFNPSPRIKLLPEDIV